MKNKLFSLSQSEECVCRFEKAAPCDFCMQMPICSICENSFTTDEWLDRHTDSAGNDCHEDCCDVCATEDAHDLEDAFDSLMALGDS